MSALTATPTAALVAAYNRAIEGMALAPSEAHYNATAGALEAIATELDERGERVAFNTHGYLSTYNPHAWEA